jgi:hypothetical protein
MISKIGRCAQRAACAMVVESARSGLCMSVVQMPGGVSAGFQDFYADLVQTPLQRSRPQIMFDIGDGLARSFRKGA